MSNFAFLTEICECCSDNWLGLLHNPDDCSDRSILLLIPVGMIDRTNDSENREDTDNQHHALTLQHSCSARPAGVQALR